MVELEGSRKGPGLRVLVQEVCFSAFGFDRCIEGRMWLFVGGPPTNNSLFVGGPPMNDS